ncbi:MAG: phosphate ABC transporter substrate-binding/OmpA family protein [Pseudomonadota bacterium]
MMRFCIAWNKVIFAGSAALALAAGPLPAGEVTLRSTEGAFNLHGELLRFADGHYVVKTPLGEFRVSAERARCEGEGCPTSDIEDANVRFAGSDSMSVGLMPLLLTGYAGSLGAEISTSETPNAGQFLSNFVADQGFGDPVGSYLVTPGTTSDAFAGLLDGSADVGLASRRITPDEARSLRDAGAGNMIDRRQEHIVAVDSIVVIAHPDNPVSQLSMQDMRDIYAGRVSNWEALGGEDRPIAFIGRSEASGTRQVFEETIFGGESVPFSSSHNIAETNAEMAAMVNADPGAIGFVPFSFQRGARPLDLVNACGIVSSPDAFTAKTGEYPLQRRLYLYTRADAVEPAADFVQYAGSEAADVMIAKAGFINLGVERKSQSAANGRAGQLSTEGLDAYETGILANLIDEMSAHDRLSTTFRFRSGSSELDERGARDLVRLIEFLGDLPKGTQVALVGFTDDVGTFDSNLSLSQRRAEIVLDTAISKGGERLDGLDFAALGFGELAASECNVSEAGRSINRRVEVWIKDAVGG